MHRAQCYVPYSCTKKVYISYYAVSLPDSYILKSYFALNFLLICNKAYFNFSFTVALAFGVKESTKFNNFCTGVNLCVVLFVIISGSFKGDNSFLYHYHHYSQKMSTAGHRPPSSVATELQISQK